MSEDGRVDAKKLAGSVVDAMNRRDSNALLALAHPDFELHSYFAAVERTTYRGPEGFRNYFRDLEEGFEDARWELDRIHGALPGDLVVVLRFTARGHESGVPIDTVTPLVWTSREGKLWRSDAYQSVPEALEAAGLSE